MVFVCFRKQRYPLQLWEDVNLPKTQVDISYISDIMAKLDIPHSDPFRTKQ